MTELTTIEELFAGGSAGRDVDGASTGHQDIVSEHGPAGPIPDGVKCRNLAGSVCCPGIHLEGRRGHDPRTACLRNCGQRQERIPVWWNDHGVRELTIPIFRIPSYGVLSASIRRQRDPTFQERSEKPSWYY